MYFFYSFFLFKAMLIYIPIYFVKSKLLRGESLHLGERLGFRLPENKIRKKSIWIHAVSVGEVLSVQNLISKIKERHPGWSIHFSSLTNTGIRVAKEKLVGVDNIFFVPLDFKRIVRKFFEVYKPDVFVLAESEFWPNLLREAKKQSKGVLLINGRISPRSQKKYNRFRFLMKNVLKNISYFLVQTEKDKRILEKIGICPDRLEVAGNLKTEINLPTLSEEEILSLKRDLGISEMKTTILAGSTHKGEEEQLLIAYAKAREKRDNLLLIIAPRHPERTEEVEKTCKSFSLRVERRTAISPGKQWDVLILDTLGELSRFYALCDIAFVGGSMIPWGGQNFLEPAFYGKPIFFGPHMDNFSYLAEKFVNSGAARIIHRERDLNEMFLFQNETNIREIGIKAKETLNSLRGATDKTLKVIEDLMSYS